MENASKALIIAGAVMVAMMITSLGVFIFSTFSKNVSDNASMDKEAIANFNSKITPYVGESISGSQVNALIQYVISNNTAVARSGETMKAITIEYEDSAGTQSQISVGDKAGGGYEVKYTGGTRVKSGGSSYYKVKATPNDDNGLMTKIEVEGP